LDNLPALDKYVELFWKFNIERMEELTKAKIDTEIHKLINKLLIESGYDDKDENIN
jgi:hypothetical protein